MLDCVNVVKRYGGKFAVNGMSVAIEDAHIYGLLGPNGSGKSTWMKMAAGLIVPDEGEMTLDGVKISAETKRHIAYMPTEGYFYSYMKIKDVGRYYQDFFDDFDAQQFEKLIADMDLEMNMKVRNLSSGMMAKLKIAVTLSRKAELYLLDEPLNGIDLLARDEVVNTILTNMSDNASVVISSHLVEELERIIDKAIFMIAVSAVVVQILNWTDMASANGMMAVFSIFDILFAGACYVATGYILNKELSL